MLPHLLVDLREGSFKSVIRNDEGGFRARLNAGLFQAISVFLYVLKGELPRFAFPGPEGSCYPSPPPEDKDIKEGISPQSVPPVYASRSLSSHEEVPDGAFAVGIDLNTPILIVLAGIDENGE